MAYSLVIDNIQNKQIVTLNDINNDVQAQIIPDLGNLVYSLQKNQQEYLWKPFTLTKLINKEHSFEKMCGIPFLAPWVNRLESDTYYVNHQSYKLSENSFFFRDEMNQPIHGLVMFSDRWKITNLSTENKATVKTQLDFWRYPDYMASFPFAHSITITCTIKDGIFYTQCEIQNQSNQSLPIAVGFHPYLRLPTPKKTWKLNFPQNIQYMELTEKKLPTGNFTKNPYPKSLDLHNQFLDDAFVHPSVNKSTTDENWQWSLYNGNQSITIMFGAKFTHGVIYNPLDRLFVCIEPMSTCTNGFNLNYRDQSSILQHISKGSKWSETYSIHIEN